jgi:cell division protein FtsB
MSWLDPARLTESAEDRALREELRDLLGTPASNFFQAEVTPEIIALAEDLRREAERRRHTSRQRPSWILLAAALPFALVLTGLGAWGFQQKQRADVLAQDLAHQDREHREQLVAVSNQFKTERMAREEFIRTLQKEGLKSPRRLGKELVIPVDRNPIPAAADTQLVKGH